MTAVDMVDAFVGFDAAQNPNEEDNSLVDDLAADLPSSSSLLDGGALGANEEPSMQDADSALGQTTLEASSLDLEHAVIPVGSPFPANR